MIPIEYDPGLFFLCVGCGVGTAFFVLAVLNEHVNKREITVPLVFGIFFGVLFLLVGFVFVSETAIDTNITVYKIVADPWVSVIIDENGVVYRTYNYIDVVTLNVGDKITVTSVDGSFFTPKNVIVKITMSPNHTTRCASAGTGC
jgi:hypothetical protein